MKKGLFFCVLATLTAFAQAEEVRTFELRATEARETDEYLVLINPHAVLADDVTLRFSTNKRTYEALCNLAFDDYTLVDEEELVSSNGTVFFDENEEARFGEISRSFRFIKCLK
jgi:hypothetical protein